MGGIETIDKLREIDQQVRAVVSSGYADNTAMAEYKKYGFKGVVAKPYTLEQLKKTLHGIVAETTDTD
jgi:CheY-like chemotaxis protein